MYKSDTYQKAYQELKMSNREEKYINYGVSSDIANFLAEKNLPVSTFRTTSKTNLINIYGIEEKIVDEVKKCIVRQPIDDEVVFKLLENSNSICNVCKGTKGQSYIIHHIKEYSKSQDNAYDNLIVLCPTCHDMAHRGGLTNSITQNQLYKFKYNWERIVKNQNVAQACKQDNVEQVEYVNIPRITELVLKYKNKLPETEYSEYLRGIYILNQDNSLKEGILTCNGKSYPFNLGEGFAIKYHYFELFKSLLSQLNFIDLETLLNKTSLKTNLIGKCCFYVGGLYGNAPKLPITESTEMCHLYFRKKYFYVEWKIDPKFVTSSTALDRLSHHSVYIIYGIIRNVGEKEIKGKKFIHIDIRPLITGIPKIQKNRTPIIKYIKESEYIDEDYEDEYGPLN